MTDNVLVSLNGFTLPSDLPWRVRFIDLVEDHLRRQGARTLGVGCGISHALASRLLI